MIIALHVCLWLIGILAILTQDPLTRNIFKAMFVGVLCATLAVTFGIINYA